MVIPFYLPPRKRKNGVFIYRKLAFVNVDAVRAHLTKAGFSIHVIERVLSKLTPVSKEEMEKILEDIGLSFSAISQSMGDDPAEECAISEETAAEAPQPTKDTKTTEPVLSGTPVPKAKSGTRSRRRRSSRKK